MDKCLTLITYLFIFTIQNTNSQLRENHFNPVSDEVNDYNHQPPRNGPVSPPIDPCHPSYHRTIRNEPKRSYNYKLGSSPERDRVLCDRDLTRGWYRFDSVAGNTIPTSCPGANYCGTRAPVWMRGALPSVEEGVTAAHACISVQGKCCTTQIPMMVKNCSSFIVYHLEPTPACPSAYCAGYEVPCPIGLSSETGYTPCHFPVDLLETKVSFGLSKRGTQLHFFCDVTLGGHVVPESVALEVEWLADEESIQSETFTLTQQQKGILKEGKWGIGQTLQCRARARHRTINTFTSLVTSPPFVTGFILTSYQPLTINEGGEPTTIEFHSSVPITCPPKKVKRKKPRPNNHGSRNKRRADENEEDGEECCVSLEVSTHALNTPRCADGNPFDLVVLNSCTYKVCADAWNITHRIPVWAVNDGLNGGGRDGDPSPVLIDIRTVEPSPPRWTDIVFPTQEILVTHVDVEERCFTGDTTMTFDGHQYTNKLEGVFLLYKNDQLPYEVQVLFKKCAQRALCACAIAIRFGEFMLGAEVCSTGKLRLWSYSVEGDIVEASKIPHLPQILRVDDGRSFQIQFPTGTRVNFGPNLRFIQIQASLSDLESTSGLCGSFDHDSLNDFMTYHGGLTCSPNATTCDDFSKAWRLPLDQSLFDGIFRFDDRYIPNEEIEDLSSPGKCSCSEIKTQRKVELRPKPRSKYASYPYEDFQPEEPEDEPVDGNNPKCSSAPCVDPRGVDVTQQLLELLFDEDFHLDDVNFGRDSSPNALEPVFKRDSHPVMRLEGKKREWTEESAEVFCLRMIEGVSTAKLCRDVAHIDVDVHTKSCKNEVIKANSGNWAMDALEQLRWECRDQVYHNITLWEPQLGRQHGTPPIGVLSSLCLNNCTALGSCDSGVCLCERGFSGSDCGVNLNEPPLATHLDRSGVCDLRSRPCSELIVWGDRFADHSAIKCHWDIYRTLNVRSVPALSSTLKTDGRMLTYQSIICDVPELPIHDAKIASFYIPGEGIDKTRTLTRLSLSYGPNGIRSTPLDYTIYDSLCWGCEGPLTCIPTPTQSCNVLSEPFGSNSDPFLQSNSPFSGFERGEDRIEYPVLAVQPIRSLHPQLGNPCQLPKEPGPCQNDVVRYFFDGVGRKCKPFIFGGCQGNGNNFESEEICASTCSRSDQLPRDGQLQSSGHRVTIQRLPLKCRRLPESVYSCQDPDVVSYYYDPERNKCRPIITCKPELFTDQATCAEECES